MQNWCLLHEAEVMSLRGSDPTKPKMLKRRGFNSYSAKISLYKPWRPKGFSQFEIIINA